MIVIRRAPLGAALLLAAATAACQTASAPPPAPPPGSAPPGVTPSTFAMPGGTGCSGEIARYRAVMDNDLAVGHTVKSVHGRVSAELDQASAVCASGRDAEATRMVSATKARFGYRQ